MKTMKELIKEAIERGYDVIITDTDGLYIEKSYNDDYWVTMADAYCVMISASGATSKFLRMAVRMVARPSAPK